MENKSKIRILLGILILLIIINLSALGTFGYQKYMSNSKQDKKKECLDNKKENQHDRVKFYIKKELQLNDEQFNSFCRLKDTNFKKTDEIWAQLMKLRETNALEITGENVDSSRLFRLCDSIGICNRNMQLEMNRHFMETKKMLNPDQIKKFNEMILHMGSRDWKGHERANGGQDTNHRHQHGHGEK